MANPIDSKPQAGPAPAQPPVAAAGPTPPAPAAKPAAKKKKPQLQFKYSAGVNVEAFRALAQRSKSRPVLEIIEAPASR
jgi:hypothetical protein